MEVPHTRRYFNYLEKSIDDGTDWVVFEVNGPALWGAVRRTVEGFLFNEWKSGALLGTEPEEAYFVRCDASTMTADDLDNGRLICLIGVAVAKPAEFVIFRISQWTATTSTDRTGAPAWPPSATDALRRLQLPRRLHHRATPTPSAAASRRSAA